MSPNNSLPPSNNSPADDEELTPDPRVDDFFARMKSELGGPKKGRGGEELSAAVHAIQKLAVQSDVESALKAEAQNGAPKIPVPANKSADAQRECVSCGSVNPRQNRYCAICGVSLPELASEPVRPAESAPESLAKAEAYPAGQHFYHHHYHHHSYSSVEDAPAIAADMRTPAPANSNAGRDAVRLRPVPGATSLSRAETAVRKLTQDWALACNTKQLDDLVDLYASDCTVLRANVPPVRGTASIREFFFTLLDAGFGDVELDVLRVELLGDVAYEAGRFKALAPTPLGKRREERGKYLLISNRQGGEWKIVADCWSSDLSLGVAVEPVNSVGTNTSPKTPPRKGA